jgi:hypothetical protein
MIMDSVFIAPAALPEDVRQRVRMRSKGLFGNLDRLEVAAAIAASSDRLVNATDLQWDLKIATNRIRAQLVALRDLGLLRGPMPDARKRYYMRVESPFWECCLSLYNDWAR